MWTPDRRTVIASRQAGRTPHQCNVAVVRSANVLHYGECWCWGRTSAFHDGACFVCPRGGVVAAGSAAAQLFATAAPGALPYPQSPPLQAQSQPTHEISDRLLSQSCQLVSKFYDHHRRWLAA